MFRKIGYGVVVWAVCYVTAIALMNLMVTDRPAFQTIMLLEGALLGSVLACFYFRDVHAGFLREGIVLGTVWVVTNWLLDFVALLPFAVDLTVWRYFVEIGFRYVGMFSTTIAIAYVLWDHLERRAPTASTRLSAAA